MQRNRIRRQRQDPVQDVAARASPKDIRRIKMKGADAISIEINPCETSFQYQRESENVGKDRHTQPVVVRDIKHRGPKHLERVALLDAIRHSVDVMRGIDAPDPDRT